MTIDISNNAARVNYTVAQGATQTSFSVPFEFFNDADLSVYVDDVLKTITTHYTVSGGDGSTGTITMSVTGASGGSTVVISRSIAIERTSDFVTGVDINRAALNTQLDTLTAIAADNKDKASRSISAPNSEVNPQLELPDADTRKGKLVGFNETTGNVELSATLADGNTLASISGDIATLADIEDGTDATDAIQTVAGISSDVTTVAGISSNVTSVAGNASNINTVAADGADIGTVAGSIASVNTNAANITDIQNASANAATATTKAAEAATSATNAATSETNAATSETNAATSASTATTQAGISTTKAGEAAASAAAALASEGAASTSETNAANSAANSSNSATLSEASRIASVAAQAAAETAETNAETAETNAAASASAASTSASNASTSETNAASSAASASTDAGTATTKAGEAATSATAAASSASSAQASKDAALAALDSFDDRYLGQKTADPTVDNDGDALVSGALYFNTTDDIMKVYDGSQWVAAYASLSGAMFGANNLSDVASISASRTTLGLGTGDTPTFAGINTTGNATFGDNDKAIFGAGSDLQIYHDGSNSFIEEAGTGNLIVAGSNEVKIRPTPLGSNLAVFKSGSVDLYASGTKRLETTSTGIDVTGTVTADGLTVDGDAKISATSPTLRITETDTTDVNTRITAGSGNLYIQTENDAENSRTDRLKIDHSTGDISFYEDTGTTPKFFWDASAESLGIGVGSSVGEALHVKGVGRFENSNATPVSVHINSGNHDYGQILASTSSAWKNLVLNQYGGNVGIGTSSPSSYNSGGYRLVVGDGAGYEGITIASGSAQEGSLYFADGTTGNETYRGHIAYNHSNDSMHFKTAAAERMRIDSSGNVGIGVSDPSTWSLGKALHIGVKENNLWGEADYAFHMNQNAYYNGGWKYTHTDQATRYSQEDGQHIWHYAASGTADAAITWSEAMRIDSSGNVGIGTGSPSQKLTVGFADNGTDGISFRSSTYANLAKILVQNETSTQNGNLQFHTRLGGGVNEAMRIDSSGNLLVGTTSGSDKVTVNGTVSATNFNTTSDATLKTNVKTLSGSLDAVKSLRGVSFDWLDNDGSEIGVIAQEVEAVLPNVVSTNDEGIKSVKYGNMVAVLIEAIKEQQLRIEALEAKLGE